MSAPYRRGTRTTPARNRQPQPGSEPSSVEAVREGRQAIMAKPTKKQQQRGPRVLVADKLKGYGTARRTLMRSIEHQSRKGPNNRAENPHQPTRQHAPTMKYFHSPATAQHFLSAFSQISPHFRPQHHLMTAPKYRAGMWHRFTVWYQVNSTAGMPDKAWSSALHPHHPWLGRHRPSSPQ